jgi:hypothetical protein
MRKWCGVSLLAALFTFAGIIAGCGGGGDEAGVSAWRVGEGNKFGFIRGTVYDENSLKGVSARVLADDVGLPTFQDGRYVIDPAPHDGRVVMSAGSGRHRARSVELDASICNLYLEPNPEAPSATVTVNVAVHDSPVQNVAVYVGWNVPDTDDGTVQVTNGRAVGVVRVEPNRRYTVSAWATGKVMDFITDLDVRDGDALQVNLDLYDATSANSGSVEFRGFPSAAEVGAISLGVGNQVNPVATTLRDTRSLTTFHGLPPGAYWVWAAVDSMQSVFREQQDRPGATRRVYDHMRTPQAPSRQGVYGESSAFARQANVVVTAGRTTVVTLNFPVFMSPARLRSPRPYSALRDRTPAFDWDLVGGANVYAVNVNPDDAFKDLYLGWSGFTPYSRLTYPPLPEAALRSQVSYYWWVDAFRIPGFTGADAADLNFLELFGQIDTWSSSETNGFFID